MKHDLTDTLRNIAEGFIDAAQNRLKLLQAEVGEETDRLLGLLAWLVVTALLALLALQFIALVVLALAWDTPWRTHAMVALTAAAAAATGFAYRAYLSARKRPKPIFVTSLEELQKDRVALDEAMEKSL